MDLLHIYPVYPRGRTIRFPSLFGPECDIVTVHEDSVWRTAPDRDWCEDQAPSYNSTIRHAKTSPGLLRPFFPPQGRRGIAMSLLKGRREL